MTQVPGDFVCMSVAYWVCAVVSFQMGLVTGIFVFQLFLCDYICMNHHCWCNTCKQNFHDWLELMAYHVV